MVMLSLGLKKLTMLQDKCKDVLENLVYFTGG